MNSTSVLLSLRESHELASAVGRCANMALFPLEEHIFEGGEFKLRPLESVRDRSVYVFQCLAGTPEASVSERLLKLQFLLYGLRDAGAVRLVVVLPYLRFARIDRRTRPRDPVNSRYVAQVLEAAGADSVVTLDVHNPAALDNSFRVPLDHLSALPMMVDHFATRLPETPLTVVSPDIGGVKRAQIFRELLEARLKREVDLAFLEKRRAQGVVSGQTLVGNVQGRTMIIVDDLCATGHTLIRALEACNRAGCGAVYAAVTHVPHMEGLKAVLAKNPIAGVVTTDSVGYRLETLPVETANKLTVLSIAPLFAEALRRIRDGIALTPLLEQWPVPGVGLRASTDGGQCP